MTIAELLAIGKEAPGYEGPGEWRSAPHAGVFHALSSPPRAIQKFIADTETRRRPCDFEPGPGDDGGRGDVLTAVPS